MIDLALPDPWPALVLVFGAYRITRFLGWDDWPPIYKMRARAIGESWVPDLPEPRTCLMGDGSPCDGHCDIPSCPTNLGLPGKQPTSEVDSVRPSYSRPTLAHLVHCPFCLGWWVSLATFAMWCLTPAWTLWLIAPFALSGAVGLVARNLDP